MNKEWETDNQFFRGDGKAVKKREKIKKTESEEECSDSEVDYFSLGK